jgi:hypothetical protein
VNYIWLDSGGILPQLSGEQRELSRAPRVLLHSALFRLVRVHLDSPVESERDLFPEIKKNTVAQYLDVLADLSRRHRFEVLVASFPRLDGHEEEDSQRGLAVLQAAAARHDFRFFDLADALTECGADGQIAWDPIHPNAAGHRCAGEAIAEFVAARPVAPH